MSLPCVLLWPLSCLTAPLVPHLVPLLPLPPPPPVQFGHLFARASTREAALRAMATALREVVIRGEVHTIVDYALDMLQSPELIGNQVSGLRPGHAAGPGGHGHWAAR